MPAGDFWRQGGREVYLPNILLECSILQQQGASVRSHSASVSAISGLLMSSQSLGKFTAD